MPLMLVGIPLDHRRAEFARRDLPLKKYVNLEIGTTLFNHDNTSVPNAQHRIR